MFSSNATQVSAVTQAEAVDFDGTNDYLSRSTDLTGSADSKTFTFSCWIWQDDWSNSLQIYVQTNTSGLTTPFVIFSISSGSFNVSAYNSAGTEVLNASVASVANAARTFTHVLVSVDLANTSNRSIYINDVAQSVTWTTYTNSAIDFTQLYRGIGARPDGTVKNKTRLSNVFLDYTYRDLSVTANRRKFITADLKPAAGQAALNPILYLPMSDPTTVGTNAGTGGDFTLTGTIARSGRGPNQYNAPYSDLDGTADYLSRTTAPTGIADGKQGTFACTFNVDATSLYVITSFSSSTSLKFVVKVGSGEITVEGYDSAGSQVFALSQNAQIKANRNYVLVLSFDTSDSNKYHLYVNGVQSTTYFTVYAATNIDYAITTTPRYYIGASATPSSFFNGRLGALWFNTSYIDLSVASNLAKFVSGTGIDAKPVDLGATGELPTGTSPLIYLPMYGNNAGKNYGTGGDFTVNSGPYTGARGPNEFWSGSGLFNNPTQAEGISLELNNSPDVTGITKTTFAVCFKRRDVDVTDNSVIFNTTSSTNNNFHFSVYFTDTEVLKVGWNGHTVATSSTITDTNWHTLLVSVDSTATVARVYLDGVSLTSTITLNRTYTQAFTYVGRAVGVTVDQCFDGNIGFVYQAHDYIDISQEANRLKFFDAFGYPVDLSAQVTAGAIPAPYIYLLFPESNLGTNNGTAGNFTNNSVTASALVKA